MIKKWFLTGSIILSSCLSFAEQEVYWQKNTVQLNVSSQGSGAFESNMVFNQILKTTTYEDCSYYTEPTYYVTTGTCYEMECSGSSSGQSKYWNDFYSAKKEQKAAKLADAIKGVGEGTAGKLVTSGIFNSKPKSWGEFKNSINKAVQQNIITEDQKRMILSTYREDNMSNLGYSSNSCKSTPYACQEVIVTSPSVYIPKTCTYVDEQVVNSKAVLYKINVTNSELLPGEVEKLSLTLSGNQNEIYLSPAYYNKYQTSLTKYNGQSAEVVIQGIGRNQVDMPRDFLKQVVITGDYKNADLEVTVSQQALPLSNDETLNIRYKVKTCKIGFLGSCGIGWDQEQTYIGTITKEYTRFKAPILQPNEKKGIKMIVEAEIFKSGSKYYNSKTLKKDSDKITLK